MRLNDLLTVEFTPSTPPIPSLPPVDASDVDRIMGMVAPPKLGGSDTSPTEGRPLFVRLPQGNVPMVSGAQLRALVDRLGLGILPEAYVREDVRSGDTLETKRAISAFKTALGDSKNAFYIVAPMEALDVAAMMSHDDMPSYVAPSERQAYQNLFGLAPMMRAMTRRIARLEERVSTVEEGVRGLERELGRVRQEQAIARQRSEEAAAQWALSRDPMIIAIPKGADPALVGMVLAGPAWGPEFGDVELQTLGLVPPARSVAAELSPLLAAMLA